MYMWVWFVNVIIHVHVYIYDNTSCVYDNLLFMIIASTSDLQKQDQYWLQGLDTSKWIYYVRYIVHVNYNMYDIIVGLYMYTIIIKHIPCFHSYNYVCVCVCLYMYTIIIKHIPCFHSYNYVCVCVFFVCFVLLCFFQFCFHFWLFCVVFYSISFISSCLQLAREVVETMFNQRTSCLLLGTCN